MQTRVTYALGFVMLAGSSIAFAGDFEGVIHMKSTFGAGEEARTSESDWFIKGDHIRMERSVKSADHTDTGRMGAMIFNADKKMSYVLMPERKMYIEHSSEDTLEKTAEHLKELKYEIVRTGKTDTVAGYRCEIFQNRNKETGKIRGESCAVKGLANMGALMGLNRSDAGKLSGDIPRELRQIIREGYFLVRMVTKDEDGSEKMRMEATSVEKKRLDSSLFVPPADYTKFNINVMMQQRTKASQEAAQGEQGQSNVDAQQMIQEMQRRKTDRSGGAGGSDSSGQQMDMQDFMKNLGEMMKKKQQGGQ
jgi:hypothetical protein